jgi:hypothetical protein
MWGSRATVTGWSVADGGVSVGRITAVVAPDPWSTARW